MRLHLGDGRGRIDGQADFHAERFDFPEQLRHALGEFNVNGDLIGAGPGKWLQQNLRLGTHQMHVEEFFTERTEGFHHRRAEGNVRHEMPVHDVEVQPVRAGTIHTRDFVRETGEI